jgi:transmembrane sensor
MSEEIRDPNMSVEPERWDALARFVAGESDPAEAARIREWLAEDPARGELVAALTRSIESVAKAPPADVDLEGALRRVKSRFDSADVLSLKRARRATAERAPGGWRTMAFRAAAAVTILVGGTFIWRTTQERGGPSLTPQTFSTSIGQTDTVALADGSQVVLGPETRLTVAGDYNTSERAVELNGEALFDVRHDASRPFSVRAGAAMIRDLGTTFSVRSDAGSRVRVVVTAGSVRLEPAAGSAEGIVLRAGDRGVLREDGQAQTESGPVSEADLAWTQHRLTFEATPLEEVGHELHRWYGIELRVADAELKQRRLTATFQGETRQQVLEIIALTVGARIEQRGDTAIVRALSGAQPR